MQRQLLTVRNVSDLQDSGKRWLEGVLGRHLKENQQVFIMVFTPGREPDEQTRRQALAGVEETMTHVEQHLSANGISAEEFDAAGNEVMKEVRQRKT